MPTRRALLKATPTLAVLAATRTLQASTPAKTSAPTKPLPWPQPIGSPVLESLRPVIEHSRDVRTHYDKIVEVAHWMAYEDLGGWPRSKTGCPMSRGVRDMGLSSSLIN
jgi:hypothetical protein